MAFPETALIDVVTNFKRIFGSINKDNTTGKPYQDWTAKDLSALGSGDLNSLRSFLIDENYAYIDQILPRNMSRAEFLRAILRETARRDESKGYYLDGFRTTPGFKDKAISVTRTAFGTPDASPSRVTEIAGVIAMRDASLDIAINNSPAFRLSDDVAAALGKKNDTAIPIDNDAKAYAFGYAVGAMPEFKRGDALNIRLNSPLPSEQIQEKYCPVVENIFRSGRAYDNRDSLVMGFMQARIDGKTNFAPQTDRVGLFAECPSTPKVANDNAGQKQAKFR